MENAAESRGDGSNDHTEWSGLLGSPLVKCPVVRRREKYDMMRH